MKTIVYILIAIFIGSILSTSIPMNAQESENRITLKWENKNTELAKVYISAEIIKQRLNKFGLRNFEVVVSDLDSTIQISFQRNEDLNKAKEMVTTVGNFEFYETLDRKQVLDMLKMNDKLFEILNKPDKNSSNSILGYCIEENKSKVEKYISESKSKTLEEEMINFAWSKFPDTNGLWSLHVLKIKSAMRGEHVSGAFAKIQKQTDNFDVFINLNEKGRDLWQEITSRNIGKSIALVIDNEVYFAPRVMEEISGGKCAISGDFTYDDASCIVALITTDKLPMQFIIVE